MPTGVYERKPYTAEHILKSALGHIGLKHPHSEETKQKLSDFWKGKRTGKSNPNFGNHSPWSDARRAAQKKRTGSTHAKIIKKGKEYPDNWQELRKFIYERDNWICQECGVKCGTTKRKDRPVIQCHHINYDTTSDDPQNLITLCASCHAKTNFGREDWIEHYRKKERIRG